jgi:hypothetical protein
MRLFLLRVCFSECIATTGRGRDMELTFTGLSTTCGLATANQELGFSIQRSRLCDFPIRHPRQP